MPRSFRLSFPATAGLAAVALLSPAVYAAQLGGTAASVLPDTTRQIVSLDYHRLGSDPVAQQIEAEVLPPQMVTVAALLTAGGANPANDLDRLTFASYQGKSGFGLIGVAEGNFKTFQPGKFVPRIAGGGGHPEQYHGTDIYTHEGLTFIEPDPTTLVFGDRNAIEIAIDTEQGALPRIDQNAALTDLIAGTQTTDVWSVLDPAGSRLMVHSLVGSSPIPGISSDTLDKFFNGARYTIAFGNDVQFNLDLVTTDPIGAATLSAALRGAVDLRAHQEANPVAKSVLGNVEVDSAGNDVILQLSGSESTLLALLHTDLMKGIAR